MPLPPEDEARLVDFLQDRDVSCPLCGYNLRNLTRAQCPECRKDLELTVSLHDVSLMWLLIAIVPGSFSGIAAFFLSIPIIGSLVFGGGIPPWQVICVDAFGWMSAVAMLVLVRRRYEFLRLPLATQRSWAAIIWVIHVAVFVLFVITVWMFG